MVAKVGKREVRTVEELLDEVDVGEDHSAAAVALEPETVERLAGCGRARVSRLRRRGRGGEEEGRDGPLVVAGLEELQVRSPAVTDDLACVRERVQGVAGGAREAEEDGEEAGEVSDRDQAGERGATSVTHRN